MKMSSGFVVSLGLYLVFTIFSNFVGPISILLRYLFPYFIVLLYPAITRKEIFVFTVFNTIPMIIVYIMFYEVITGFVRFKPSLWMDVILVFCLLGSNILNMWGAFYGFKDSKFARRLKGNIH